MQSHPVRLLIRRSAGVRLAAQSRSVVRRGHARCQLRIALRVRRRQLSQGMQPAAAGDASATFSATHAPRVQPRAGHALFAILFRLHVRAQCRCVLKVPPAAAQKPPLSRGLHTAATTHRRTQSRRSKTGPCPASLRQAAAACSAASAVRTLARAHAAAASAAYFNLCRRVESLPHQVRRC